MTVHKRIYLQTIVFLIVTVGLVATVMSVAVFRGFVTKAQTPVANSALNPENIVSGEFGLNVGQGSYVFPEKVGIGSINPNVLFTIGNGNLAGYAPAGINFHSILNGGPAGNALNGVFAVNQNTANVGGGPQAVEGYTVTTHDSGTVKLALATIGNLEHAGSGTVDTARGLSGITFISKAGTINNAVGIDYAVSLLSSSTGNIQDARGLNIVINDQGAGTITTGYGVYIGDINANTDFGIYQVDQGADNYFAGNVGIGTSEPTEKLEVKGGIRLNTTEARPKCNLAHRSVVWVTQGGVGVTDKFEVCIKTASNTYVWRTL